MIDSIRIRLTLWYVGVLALIVISFAALTYFLMAQVIRQETDETLADLERNFTTEVRAEYEEKFQRQPEANVKIEKVIAEIINESRFRDYIFAVYDEDSRLVASTSDDNDLNARLPDGNETELMLKTAEGKQSFRLSRTTFILQNEQFNLVTVHPTQDQQKFLFRVRSVLFFVVPLIIFVTGISGYFLARKSLAPVVDMSRRAANISATNLHERLPVKNEKDELGNLAQVFNALLQRLEGSFEQQRRFMADASHELRTPLAIVRGESEVALSKEDRPNEELRESLGIVNDESRRLTKIVEDLFTLARADAGQFKAQFTPFYLDELLNDCVRPVKVLAARQNTSVEISDLEEMPLRGDEQLLRRLFLNLLDNAIKYNRENGKVSISGKKDSKNYRIFIEDSGTGISDEEREKIFKRFYRADKARSRDRESLTSGAGLGLSIALWIAELHGGTIEIVSSDQSGSVFAVVLPLN